MPIRTSFHLKNNSDGTLDSDYPLGDKGAATPTLSINTTGLQSLVGTQIGSPYSINIRQFVSSQPNGSYAAAATISFNSHTGDDPATHGYTAPGTGDNLTCAANVLTSGQFDFKVHNASVPNDAISALIPFSVIALSTAAWDWVPANGLNNGDPLGANWVAFGGATLNANPVADGYLEITFAGPWGGISTNDLAHPLFKNSYQYTVHITEPAGGTRTAGAISINQGTAVAFTGTGAHTLTVISGTGSNSFVVHDNGGASAGQKLRITLLDANEDANVVQFDQANYIGNVGDSTISFTASRAQPSAASQSVTVSVLSGGTHATLNTTTLTWAANVGGQKTGTVTPISAGPVVLQLSAPTIGSLGAQTQTTITISAAAGAVQYPLVSASLLDNDTSLPNPWDTLNQPAVQQYLGKFDFVIIKTGVQDAEAWRGSSLESIASAIKTYSTRANGTRVFGYHGTLATKPPGEDPGYSADLITAMNVNNWFLRDSYPSGGVVPSTWDPNETLVNNTLYSNLDSNGRREPQFLAYYAAGWIHNGLYGNTASATIDGTFFDDIFMYPQRGGDYNQDGSYDDPATASVQTLYRQGLAAIVSTYKTNNSSKLCGANVATMADSRFTNLQAQAPEFWRLLHGGQIEHFWARGTTSSAWWYASTWAGRWPLIVSHLRNIEDAMLIPQIVGLGGYPSDGNPASAQSMQEFRYAMAATAILTNMCCHWSDSQTYTQSTLYDLHGYLAGTAVAGSTGTRQSASWATGGANGVWRRVFSNGAAYVNPLGNGPVSFSLGATMYVLRGDLTMTGGRTGGAAVTSISLGDGDGCFLSATPT